MKTLTNELVSTDRIENVIFGGFALGAFFSILYGLFGKKSKSWGPKAAKVWVELQRKSFHMIGGCIICSIYHWCIKYELMTSAYLAEAGDLSNAQRPLDGASALLVVCFVTWMIEASRLLFDSVQKWYLNRFKGLVREKEINKAAGIAYFLPGALVAALAGPENLALLGILFLSIGDAAASIGTAAGSWRVGRSARMWEGSIGCFTLCMLIAVYVGLSAKVALVTCVLVTFGELLAEVIGLDDNFVIPVLGVLGVRIALAPQLLSMAAIVGFGALVGVLLGAVVGATSCAEDTKASSNGAKKS